MSDLPRTRPLSPHLSVYRWQLHMTLSILHRATGTALALCAPALVLWLWAAAYSPECFDSIVGFFESGFGQLILFGLTFAFYLHLANGVRHLFWDIGRGFGLETVTKSGWAVIVFAFVATLLTWWGLLATSGGAA